MRIYNSFLTIFCTVILLLLPLTGAVYAFRTDARTDSFLIPTAVAVTIANATLLGELYNDDLGSVSIASTLGTDAPLPNSINVTNEELNITGLTANTSRTLNITYDFDAFMGSAALNRLADILPWIWLLMLIALAPAALYAILSGRAG